MLACERHADALWGYLYGELTPPEAEAFLAHAKTCAGCTEELKLMQGVRSTVARAAPLPDPPDAITHRILDAARNAPHMKVATGAAAPTASSVPGWLRWFTRPWAMGLAVAGAGAMAAVFVNTQDFKAPAASAPVLDDEFSQVAKPKRSPPPAQPTPEPPPAVAVGASAKDEAAVVDLLAANKSSEAEAVRSRAAARAPSEEAKKKGAIQAGLQEQADPPADWGLREKASSSARVASRAGAAEAKADKRPAEAQERGARRDLGADGDEGGAVATGDTERPRAEPTSDAKVQLAQPLRAQASAPGGGGYAGAAGNVANLDDRGAAPAKPATRPVTASPLALPSAPAASAAPPPPEQRAALAVRPMAKSAGGPAPAPPPAAESEADEAPQRRQVVDKNLVMLPKSRKAEATEESTSPASEARQAIAKEMVKMKEARGVLKAQEELSAGAELLEARDPEGAYVVFKRAEVADIKHELAPNPRMGQVVALARMGRCDESATLARAMARQHPSFSRTPVAFDEVAQCFDKKGAGKLAAAARTEADTARKALGGKASTAEERTKRGMAIASLVQAAREPRRACELAGNGNGELPRANGAWNVTVTVDARGKATRAEVKPPKPAARTQECIKRMLLGMQYPSGNDVTQDVPVSLTVRFDEPSFQQRTTDMDAR